MAHLPIIVGCGGISPAGRSSGNHGYRRLVLDALPEAVAQSTLRSLRALMGAADGTELGSPAPVAAAERERLCAGTLIRKIAPPHFSPDCLPNRVDVELPPGETLCLQLPVRRLPDPLPEGWTVEAVEAGQARLRIAGGAPLALMSQASSSVRAAGQLPEGFAPGSYYPSRGHPRGLEMTIFAVSDALDSLGIDWSQLAKKVPPDAISVYAGSAMSQLDALGYGGMIQSRLAGKRVSARQCPFGFAEMAADFINAYVIGSLGQSGHAVGACASFLYNLRLAIADIRSGQARIAVVGCSEAPIVAEIVEGYAAMGALATDAELLKLDGLEGGEPDHRRACRPFARNCGFTIAESAQFLVLFDDALAVETGAQMHGAVAEVTVNADGFKKSIAAPGAGNYLTVARALGCAENLLGRRAIQQRSFIMAHGTGTPQNRTTESAVLDRAAAWFGIENWPVAAVKCYLGHSIGTAAGDQVMAALGVWRDGWLPGISTMGEPAADVHCEHLRLSQTHMELGAEGTDLALINSKGFGGNNATALLLAPHVVQRMLRSRHGKTSMQCWQQHNEAVCEAAAAMDLRASAGEQRVRYHFDDERVLDGEDFSMERGRLRLSDELPDIAVDGCNPYPDLCVDAMGSEP